MIRKYFKYVKYIVSGSTAALTNIALLYVLTEYGHIYYLLSAAVAFIFSVMVSFVLQKYWTFGDTARAGMERQALLYLAVSLVNLGLNTLLLYMFVEFLHMWYVVAAIVASAIMAVITFFIYRYVIFTGADRLH